MRVLVVDDEPLVRLSLARALRKDGHEVRECPDGQSALSEWRQFRPEVVYLDILMPRLTGPELLKVLEPETRALSKVILMSAFAAEYDLNKVRAMGADLFIAKPFEDVFAVVRRGEDLLRKAQRDE